MKKMKNETWLGKLYFPVSVTLLLVAGLCRGRVQTVITILLAAWTLLMVLHRFRGGWFRKCKAKPGRKKEKSAVFQWEDEEETPPHRESDGHPEEDAAHGRTQTASLSDDELSLLLQHVSLRISDKLKSAYPEATWQWTREPSLKGILSGATVRISVERMEKYTHADISFDRFGRIHIEPMTIGSFGNTGGDGADGSDQEDEDGDRKPSEPSVTDPAVWYQLIGQKILEAQISNLNAKGHTDIILATLEAFPAKTYWPDLISILSEDELSAKITDDRLQVSWI